MPKWLANEPVTAIVGLATALSSLVTAFGERLGLNSAEDAAINGVILAVAILLARGQTQPTGSA